MERTAAILAGAEQAITLIASVLMVLIMAIVSVDVVMRYGFNAPIRWVHDFITLYAMVGIFFLSLASSYRERAHIGVDILTERLPARGRVASELFGDLAGLFLFALIFVYGFGRFWTSFVNGESLSGLIAWPTWLSNGLVPLGALVMTLRLALNAVNNVLRFARNVAPPAHRDPL